MIDKNGPQEYDRIVTNQSQLFFQPSCNGQRLSLCELVYLEKHLTKAFTEFASR